MWGSNLEEHDHRLDAVLKKVSEHNLKLNAEKCMFRKEMVTNVGHQLLSEGLKPNSEKIREVKEMQKPDNQKSLINS